jgi:hypothetical protein
MSSPEPMALGSPTQSPAMGGQYLPQYLLGDHSSFNSSQVKYLHIQFIIIYSI